MRKGILIGIIVTVVVAAVAGFFAIELGWIPANADARPWAIERWAAMTSLRATLERQAPTEPNPVTASPESLEAGLRLYSDNCQVCHGGADGKPSNIARGLYQHPPQLAKHGVEDDPAGDTYWKVRHGIRWTAMPAFGETMSEREMWEVTLFLQKMSALPPEVDALWRGSTPSDTESPAAAAPSATGTSKP